MKINYKFVCSLPLLLALSLSTQGQEVNPAVAEVVEDIVELEELVVVGSRFGERSVADSPVPVDVLDQEELSRTGNIELGRAIQALAPSFNFSTSTISDGTDSVRPATLRGMGPDQVLVLVNGKRRHGSALIHVNTSVGRGNAGTDINAIPMSAIERVEVLRDGASAQYGSDAVAGVINIVLKDGYEGGLRGLYGATYKGDGQRRAFSINEGFALKNEGVLHAALEYNARGRTNRAGLTGVIQYPDTESVALSEFDSPDKDHLLGIFPAGTRVILDDPGNKEREFDRRNFRVGDAELEQVIGSLNFKQPFLDWLGEVYGFADFARSTNLSGGFYRRANQFDRNPLGSSYPHGFLPLIDTTVQDFSLGGGFRREFENGLAFDLSVVHGGNDFNFVVRNSHNASWVNRALNPEGVYPAFPWVDFSGSAPPHADAGSLSLDLTTVNLDFSIPLEKVKVAWGAEYRRDRYQIIAGERYSYADYDGPGGGTGGIQVFPGFRPENVVDATREAMGLYTDMDFQLGDRFQLSPGLRFENYSDFGDTTNGKIASKLDVTDTFTLRASVSSGFRAPSMQQVYFNNVSTQFLPGPSGDLIPFEVGTFRNDGALARDIGIPELDQETSISWSGGFVFQPSSSFSLTTDLYQIEVDDRIILSGQMGSRATELSSEIRETLTDSGVGAAQFFMNGVDTETRGAELVATWVVPLDFPGDVLLQVLGSIMETKVEAVNLPAGLPGSLFNETDRSIIEDWQPENRVTLSALYELGDLAASVSLQRYGSYSVTEGGREQTYDPEFLTDIQLTYQLGNLGSFKLGAQNVFDVTPEITEISRSRSGTIIDDQGNLIVATDGVFPYSRRSAPFGFNGGFYYAAFEFRF